MMLTGACTGGFNFFGYVLWIFGIIWSSYSAASLLVADEFLDKKPLITYPIILAEIFQNTLPLIDLAFVGMCTFNTIVSTCIDHQT